MRRVIVIGSGAGGAMAAKMLAKNFDVTVLEEGKAFKPFSLPLEKLAKFRKTGLYFDERLIQLLLPISDEHSSFHPANNWHFQAVQNWDIFP